MDAAQKLLKNIGILTATALLLSATGLATTLNVAPLTVAIPATTGSNSASVTSSDGATTPITFTIGAPTYTNGDPAWLLPIQGGTTTPTSLEFTIRNSGLSQALHTATVVLHPTIPASGVADVMITVTYDPRTGGGGGGSSTLSASQTTLNLTSIITEAFVTISTTNVAAINIHNPVTVTTTTGGNWLSAGMTFYSVSANDSDTLTISANPLSLPAGTYQGTVELVPDSGTPLDISVSFTVGGGGGGGNGSWFANPSAITWNFTVGGASSSQSVAVTTTSGLSQYAVVTTQTSSANHWLLVAANGNPAAQTQAGIPVGLPFTLSINATAANNLTQGTYTEQANILDSNSVQQATVTVTLTVNGGTAGLTISPGSIPFTAGINGSQQSQVVTLTSSTGGALTINGCTSLTWLTCTLPSTSNLTAGVGVSFTVRANPSGLAANTYFTQLQIQVGAQSGTVNVTFVVGGGGTATGAAPASLAFAYEFGTNTTSVARQKLVITGTEGSWSSSVTVNTPANGSWLNLSPVGGSSLPDPSIDGEAPVVTVDPTGLPVGSYAGSITLTTLGGVQTIQVSLQVLSSTVILPNPGSLIFTAQTGQAAPNAQIVFVSASDNALGTLGITAVASDTWMHITAGNTYVSVSVDQTGLATGLYSGSVSISQTGAANSPTKVPVILVVNSGVSSGAPLSFSQSSITFTSTSGVTTPSSTKLTVSAAAATAFTTSISYNSGSGWLTLSPTSGTTPRDLLVTPSSAGLLAGTYSATINFNANGAAQTVSVSLRVNSTGGNVNVTPTSLTFTTLQGSNPTNQTLSVTSASGSAGISFTVTPTTTSGGSWLSASASSGTTPFSLLSIIVNSSTLGAGTYTGNIKITPSGGTAVNVPVTLTITAAATISTTPTSLTFSYRLGDAAPAAQPLTVSGSGATFTATATSSGNWLVVTPTTGTVPGTVNVSINKNNITATGTLLGTVVVAAAGGASGSTTVNVTLNVTSLLPTLSRVTNAASYAANAISPGEIITLFADDPTHPIGPATPARLTLDANGNVATSIGGVQVTVAGYNCPMIYASPSQVSAVVPYEVKILGSATVLVKYLGQSSNGILMNVVTTAPGLFTTNASGTGPGAILNSDLSPNTAANPAARGDIVVIYMTGEGETSPGGVTGKVTTVASPPAPLTPGPLLQPSVTIGGQPANWTFAGEAPGFVSGVMQLNVVVPTNIAAGDQPIVVTLGGVPSQQGVTLSVK